MERPVSRIMLIMGMCGVAWVGYNYFTNNPKRLTGSDLLAYLAYTEAAREPAKGQRAVMLTAALRAVYGKSAFKYYKPDLSAAILQHSKSGRAWFDGVQSYLTYVRSTDRFYNQHYWRCILGIKSCSFDNKYAYFKSKITDRLKAMADEVISMSDTEIIQEARDLMGTSCALFYKNDRIAPTRKMGKKQRRNWQLRVPVARIANHRWYIDPVELSAIEQQYGNFFCSHIRKIYPDQSVYDPVYVKSALLLRYQHNKRLFPRLSQTRFVNSKAQEKFLRSSRRNYRSAKIPQLMKRYKAVDRIGDRTWKKLRSIPEITQAYRLRGVGARVPNNNPDYARLHPKAKYKLDKLMQLFQYNIRRAGIPVSWSVRPIITSMLRPSAYNIKIKGSSRFSAHKFGMAVDFSFTNFDLLHKGSDGSWNFTMISTRDSNPYLRAVAKVARKALLSSIYKMQSRGQLTLTNESSHWHVTFDHKSRLKK